MEIVLCPFFETERLVVEARFVSDLHRQVIARTGYSRLELYPRLNDLAHTVAGLIISGRIEVECLGGDTPEIAYSKILARFVEVVEILQIAELGGTPQSFRGRSGQRRPLSTLDAEGAPHSNNVVSGILKVSSK